MTSQPVDSTPSSSLVITYFGWWDCPRYGIVTEDGLPHYFASDFSEELDDYDPVFRLWPVPDEALERELKFWDIWVAWRASFDRGERPAPIEQQDEFRKLSDELRSFRVPPQDALLAIPHWELDRDRSFAVHPRNIEFAGTLLRRTRSRDTNARICRRESGRSCHW